MSSPTHSRWIELEQESILATEDVYGNTKFVRFSENIDPVILPDCCKGNDKEMSSSAQSRWIELEQESILVTEDLYGNTKFVRFSENIDPVVIPDYWKGNDVVFLRSDDK